MSTSASRQFASQIAPYSDPPDQQHQLLPSTSQIPSSSGPKRPWFPARTSSQAIESSYQSGHVPTLQSATSPNAISLGSIDPESQGVSIWETRLPIRVDLLAASAYVAGPISAFLLLILETKNDFVRFHAYQSAMATTLLLLLVFFTKLLFPTVLFVLALVFSILTTLWLTGRTWYDASTNGLSRYYIQFAGIGDRADSWVTEE